MRWGLILIIAGGFSMREAFAQIQVSECRARLLSKQEYVQNEGDWKQELINIDRKVKALTLRRNLHQTRAARFEEDAKLRQRDPDLTESAMSAWTRTEKEKSVVRELQVEIDRLQRRKIEILKEHNL